MLWSSAMCRSRDGSEPWFMVALETSRMGRSTSEWKTLPWDENFFSARLVAWGALSPRGSGCRVMPGGAWLDGGHSKLEEELWRLSLSLPGPKEEENPLGLSRVWKEETRVRPDPAVPLALAIWMVPLLKERLLLILVFKTGLWAGLGLELMLMRDW